ncbi:MAG TPA: phosphoribosylamine--glycine ligase [Bacillota bacterium]|nr:phosphoribosylamine--glycine ligase [Bacillota bacterium]HQD18713.1 phosphoribosylamine--glycine ligase [Bacillota bacterium]
MKVLVVGGGGREHALVWALSRSSQVKKLYCTPGNPGIEALAECTDIGCEGTAAICDFAESKGVDLVVVGPEAYLAAGVIDELRKRGITAFGPTKAAARIETDKAFAKQLMERKRIPTARFRQFDNPTDAEAYVKTLTPPIVVKANGLAAGKGVTIAQSHKEAVEFIRAIMNERIFGDAGDLVIIEEFLVGEEASVLAFCDGRHVVPLEAAQDHKRAYDGDTGPNTGGMGAYSPVSIVDDAMLKRVVDEILIPAVEGLAEEGTPYIGVLYAGLMIGPDGPKVVEFNARFGDPEAQAVLPRLRTDLADVMQACANGDLDGVTLEFLEDSAVCVMMTSSGYPGHYQTGYEIKGLDRVRDREDVIVFHSGTSLHNGRLVTSGGRVLGVTALGSGIRDAANRAYEAVRSIKFENARYRTDIGFREMARVSG